VTVAETPDMREGGGETSGFLRPKKQELTPAACSADEAVRAHSWPQGQGGSDPERERGARRLELELVLLQHGPPPAPRQHAEGPAGVGPLVHLGGAGGAAEVAVVVSGQSQQ